jgi:hypothetical protein
VKARNIRVGGDGRDSLKNSNWGYVYAKGFVAFWHVQTRGDFYWGGGEDEPVR